ncbi:DUF863 domain-containing protein [Melia azedarach]|uniref:DUF863 domain-containing protein n=1 Tax=Melia azedarach TaxID=155640 RepID=A0ACC1X7I5_MELAZ|nr:DUF863 domain-containing protein [Melia azedarach]
MVEIYLRSRKHEVTRDRDGNLSIHAGMNSGCNDDILSANLHIWNPHGLDNLNEPIKVTEAYPSASSDVLGNTVYSKEEMERRVLSSNSHSGFQGLTSFCQDPGKGREAGFNLSNMHLENERQQKGWLPYSEPGRTTGNGRAISASFTREDFPMTSRSQQAKKKIFGVEICERNVGAPEDSLMLMQQQPFVPLSNVAQSESSSISSQRKLHSGFSHDMTTVQSSFTRSNKSSVTLMESPKVTEDRLLVRSNSQSIRSINAEASSQNYLCSSSQLKSKESRVCHSSNGFGHLNGINDGSSASERFAQDSRKKCRDIGSLVDGKSAEQKKADVVPLNRYQNEVISQCAKISANGTSKQNPDGGLSWLKGVPSCNGDSSEESQGSSQLNLHSLQNSFKQFVDKTEMMRKSCIQSNVQDSLSATCAVDAEHRRNETGECSSNKKILGFSISENPCISKELPLPSTPSKESCIALAVDNADSLKVESPNNKAQDAKSPRFGEQQKVEVQTEKGLINHSADSRHHIDLNLSVVDGEVEEEEYHAVPPGFESFQSQVKEPVDLLQTESGKVQEGPTRDAAEALVAISSSFMPPEVNTCCHQSTDTPVDPLQWFVDIISSHKSVIENEVGSVTTGEDSIRCEDIIPDGMDYFEYMTLNLAETEVEECCYQPQVFENPKPDNILAKRPRRGQGRRGRQRKDFQRDVLPTLTSLLKNEVTEDLQTIEGLIQATGGTWKSSLAMKTTRNGPGRRKRRLASTEVCPPETQVPKCKEVALEDGNLTGWGKRTRRPPRQRCLIASPPLAIK